jgi:hypothetical protein
VILAEVFGGVRSDTRKNGTPPMNDKEVLTEAEELRRQLSLLSTFEEIAQTFLSSVSGERGDGKVFTSLQDYLDGSVLINGAYCSRRTVLLAIHDMKDKQEAPSALQSKTLSKLDLLNVRPVPQVIFYDDIATAILRMEVVLRLEAMQALDESAPGAAGRLAPALGQTPKQRRWTANGSMSKLRTIGYGLAAVVCCAGAISFLNSGHAGDFYTVAPAQLAANHVEMITDTKWCARDCISSNDDVSTHIDGKTCTPGASPAYNHRRLLVIGNSFSAAECVMYSALTKAGLGSVIAASSSGASPVREVPNYSPWATSVEANYIARPTLLSEVQTQ